ncbi:MAG: response regulator [Sphingomicrobium sp.]
MRVLIVEDNPLLGFLIETSLADVGHDPLGPVPTVDSALDILQSTTPDLAFVDINLDGEQSGLVLGNAFNDRGIPFFYASGQLAIARSAAAPAMGLIPKPFSPELLVGVVNAVEGYRDGNLNVSFPPEVEIFVK